MLHGNNKIGFFRLTELFLLQYTLLHANYVTN